MEVGKNSSKQLEFMLMVNGNPVRPDASQMAYETEGTVPTGSSVSAAGLLTTGSGAGSFDVVGTYSYGGQSWSCPVEVTVA